jgi:hypothetical protein
MAIINQVIKGLIFRFAGVHGEESFRCKIVVQYWWEDQRPYIDNWQIIIVRYADVLQYQKISFPRRSHKD